MKKLIYLLLFVPFTFLGQSFLAIEQDSPLELSDGWNMIGYTCYEPKDVIEAFLSINDKVIIAKDNNGAVYMPEFGFNGIGVFEYGYGYQLKLTESISDFQFCPAIVPLFDPCDCCGDMLNVSESCVMFCASADIICDDLEGCTSEWADNYDPNAIFDDGSCYRMGCTNYNSDNLDLLATIDDGSCYREGCMSDWADNYDTLATQDTYDVCYKYGCMNSTANNFDSEATVDDGSCLFSGCMDVTACNYNPEANMSDGSCVYPELGYDCAGNIVPQYQVGDLAEGGIIFQINEDGTGLVAAMEDLTEGATDPDGTGFNGYEWGCYEESVNGADGQAIGTGYQNTLDIANQGCTTEYGGITAAQAALDAEINGYSDWYIPSRDELQEMHNTIGNGGPEGNIGGFETSDWPYYWSSSEYNNYVAWLVLFDNGTTYYPSKNYTYRVRVIRAF